MSLFIDFLFEDKENSDKIFNYINNKKIFKLVDSRKNAFKSKNDQIFVYLLVNSDMTRDIFREEYGREFYSTYQFLINDFEVENNYKIIFENMFSEKCLEIINCNAIVLFNGEMIIAKISNRDLTLYLNGPYSFWNTDKLSYINNNYKTEKHYT